MVHDNNLKTLRYLFQNFPIIKDLEEGITYELCRKAILSNISVMKLLMGNLKFAQEARVIDRLFDTAIQQGGLDIVYLLLGTLEEPKHCSGTASSLLRVCNRAPAEKGCIFQYLLDGGLPGNLYQPSKFSCGQAQA